MNMADMSSVLEESSAPKIDVYECLLRCRACLDPAPDMQLEAEVLRFSGLSPEMAVAFVKRPLVLFRAVATPNREMMRFLRLAGIAGRMPLLATIPQDRFSPTVNPAKRRLAKLPVAKQNGDMGYVNVVSFDDMDGRRFTDMRCLDGTPFLDMHNELMQIAIGPQHCPMTLDLTEFLGDQGSREYYPRFLSLFTCFAVLAECYPSFGIERSFTEEVFLPAFEQVTVRFGIAPRIARLLPPGDELAPSWEFYPDTLKERALRATRRPPAHEAPQQ